MATPQLVCTGWYTVARDLLRDVVNRIEKPEFFSSFLRAVKETVVHTLNTILAKYDVLNLAKIDLEKELLTLLEDLKRAVEKACQYVEHVRSVHLYGSNERRIEKIREGIERRNFKLLTEFITQLETVYLARAEESCREAESAFESVRSSAQELSTTCKKRAVEANTRQTFATVASRTAAAGGIGVGLVVAGVGTFGISTIVGLGLGYAMYCESSKNEELKKKFGSLGKSFDDAKARASRMCDRTRSLAWNLESASTAIDTIKEAKNSHEGPSYVTFAFDCLCERIKDLESARLPTDD